VNKDEIVWIYSHFEAEGQCLFANYRPAIRCIFPRKSGRMPLLSGLPAGRQG